jgi:hypothetical protein
VTNYHSLTLLLVPLAVRRGAPAEQPPCCRSECAAFEWSVHCKPLDCGAHRLIRHLVGHLERLFFSRRRSPALYAANFRWHQHAREQAGADPPVLTACSTLCSSGTPNRINFGLNLKLLNSPPQKKRKPKGEDTNPQRTLGTSLLRFTTYLNISLLIQR